ncbi:MAG: 23S rRNA (pseudouridine(1915)-N(3))-methyltransferase RlmH [Bacteroidia bacterium]|nr:23S rRNA (pseudouridine(1915)-N(3))-methyltransferase RlmH [Bacteroidia bacterium]
MTIKLIAIGKTDRKEVSNLFDEYFNRLKHYARTELIIIPDLKNRKAFDVEQQKKAEGLLILKKLNPNDIVVLLDENGREMSSEQLAKYLQKKMNSGMKQLVFVIGGPYGFSQEIYKRANESISLSKMTFSHQMVRIFFAEQLFRAFTIIRGESYHHK